MLHFSVGMALVWQHGWATDNTKHMAYWIGNLLISFYQLADRLQLIPFSRFFQLLWAKECKFKIDLLVRLILRRKLDQAGMFFHGERIIQLFRILLLSTSCHLTLIPSLPFHWPDSFWLIFRGCFWSRHRTQYLLFSSFPKLYVSTSSR